MPRTTQVQKQPVPKASHAPVPKPQIHTPTMMDSVKSGFGFGMGSAIARSIVDSIFRAPEPKGTKDPNAKAEFVKCMESNTYEECNLFLDKI
jgi:hypothetical protein